MQLYINVLNKSFSNGMESKYPGGVWRTIRGHHVYLKKDGKIAKETLPRGAKRKDFPSNSPKNTNMGGTKNEKPRARKEKPRTDKKINTRTVSRNNDKRVDGKPRNVQGASGGTSRQLPIKMSGGTYNKVHDPKAFRSAILAAKKGNAYGAFVDAHSVEDYATYNTFIAEDNSAGISVTPDGDIVSVFKNPKLAKGKKNVSTDLLFMALQNGGKTLDCFDGFLPDLYGKFGFEPVARVAFDRTVAPEDWNYERDGEPDVVFFKHNGDSLEQIMEKQATGAYPRYSNKNVPLVSYDEAIALRNKAMGIKVQKNDLGTQLKLPLRMPRKPKDPNKTPTKNWGIPLNKVLADPKLGEGVRKISTKRTVDGSLYVNKMEVENLAQTEKTMRAIFEFADKNKVDVRINMDTMTLNESNNEARRRCWDMIRTKCEYVGDGEYLYLSEAIQERVKRDKSGTLQFPSSAMADIWIKDKYPRLKPDLKNLSPKHVNTIVTQFDNLVTRFPEAISILNTIGIENVYRNTTMRESTYACVNTKVNAIDNTVLAAHLAFNTQYFGNDSIDLEAKCKENQARGWVNQGTVESVITHEFGHIVHAYLEQQDPNFEETFFNWWVKEGSEVSHYACRNYREGFAEAFSNAIHSDNPTKLGKRVLEVVNKKLGVDIAKAFRILRL